MSTHSTRTRDKEHQLFFPTGEGFNQAKYDALEKWIKVNPMPFAWVLENLETLRDKRGYCSGSRIRSALRDRYPNIAKVDEFKFNNNLTKYLKFRVVYLKPELLSPLLGQADISPHRNNRQDLYKKKKLRGASPHPFHGVLTALKVSLSPKESNRGQKAPGFELGHHRAEVSSDAMLRRHRLTDSSTALLAQIIRATPAQVAGTPLAKVFGGSFTVSAHSDYVITRSWSGSSSFTPLCMPSARSE
jgi:hypothetical protein